MVGVLDAAQIHNLVSFFNERLDVKADGVLQARPVTPWSRPQDRQTGAAPDASSGSRP